MANETVTTIVGNLGGDPELRFTQNGAAVASFTIASTPRIYNRDRNAWVDGDVLWLTCSAWRDLAENISESLRKGDRVIATGRLSENRWEDKDGGKHSKMQLDVTELGVALSFATAVPKKAERKSNEKEQETETRETATRSRSRARD